MNTQPKALYLADILEDAGKPADVAESASAELRRLHAELERCKQVGYKKMSAQRDALLEALKEIVTAADGSGWDQLDASFSKARAAIKAAEENT